jgi:small subunit ribosomal protein S19
MVQKFMMKGKSWEEIEKLPIEEFVKMLPSRQRRALKRGLTEQEKKLLKNIRANRKKFHKTHCREMVIIPEMVGVKIGVHNGREFVAVEVKPEMLGHRLGEYSMTRKKVEHSAPGFGATKSSKFVPLK